MRGPIRVGCVAVAVLAMACSGKLATGGGSDGGEGDAQVTSSSGGIGGSSNGASSGSSGASSSGIGSSSGTGSGSSGASGSSSGPPGDDGGFDAGINCGSIPTLHQNPAGDIYCGLGADGGTLDCLASAGEGMCCLGGSIGSNMYAPQACSPNAMVGCDNGGGDAGPVQPIGIQCSQIADCTANGFGDATACCLQGGSAPTIVPGCGYLKVKGGSAIVCEGGNGAPPAACAAGEVQICSSNADCPSGTTCTPGKWKIFQLGFCQ